ncbi:MAG: type II secretion system F family protein [Planctomycetes bacterium]|nr:type II secretion system F family protein [Planctomycetota bacterium]
MPLFVYEGVDRSGKKVAGEVDAQSVQEATAKVRKLGYFPTNVRDKGTAQPAEGLAHIAPKKRGGFYIGGVSGKMLAQFTIQLSVLQDAGLPLLRSLKILANQLKPSRLKNIVEDVAGDVEGGSPFSEALAKHPSAFDRLYVNMVKAGEAGGVLDTVLQRLATFMAKAQALKRKIIGAMTYPAVVITVAVLILTVIMTKVVPQFAKIFEEMQTGKGLPYLTQVLIDISTAIATWWYLIPGIPLAIYFIIVAVGKNPQGRMFIDRIKLHLPLVGIIIRKAAIARFCRTLGTLLASGVPILEALTIVRNAIGNEVIANAVQKVHDSIREGESIVGPLAQSGVFDQMVINMIEVGEESGEVDKMLAKIADNYEADVDVLVSSLSSILEPLIIVILGIGVGFIVIALFYPLIDLMKELGQGK